MSTDHQSDSAAEAQAPEVVPKATVDDQATASPAKEGSLSPAPDGKTDDPKSPQQAKSTEEVAKTPDIAASPLSDTKPKTNDDRIEVVSRPLDKEDAKTSNDKPEPTAPRSSDKDDADMGMDEDNAQKPSNDDNAAAEPESETNDVEMEDVTPDLETSDAADEASPKKSVDEPSATNGDDAAKREVQASDAVVDSADNQQPSERKKVNGDDGGSKSPARPQSDDDGLGGAGISQLAIDREGEPSSQPAGDVAMTDAPVASGSGTKLAREREEDEEDEPAAKRVRTDGEAEPSAFKSDKPSTGAPELDELPRWLDSSLDGQVITDSHRKQYRHYLALAKKTTSGAHFRDSVTKLWPNLAESYAQLIEKPMDLGEIDRKMRDGKYTTVGQMRDDLGLIYHNCVKFNGPDSWLNKSAHQTLATVWGRILEVKVSEPAPNKQTKAGPSRHETRVKHAPTPSPAPAPAPAPPQPRRQSSSAVISPTDAPAEQAYAIPPGGVPQIRRASTLSDGTRPKRAIQAPKNKDLEYSSRPNKKQLKPELQFCEKVIKELMADKNRGYNAYFLEPVDPVFHRIPNYFSIIKKPMDLGTIAKKMANGEYQSSKHFEADVKLVVSNCVKFNGTDALVSLAATSLEAAFKEEMSGKSAWMAKNAPKAPQVEPSSAPNSDGESEDEEAAEAPTESRKAAATNQNSNIEVLEAKLKEEVQKLTEMYLSNPKQGLIEVQQLVINQFTDALMKAKEKASKDSSSKPSKPKPSKPTKSKVAKDAAPPSKRTSLGAVKKSAPVPPKKKRKLTEEERLKLPEGISSLAAPDVNRAIELIKRDTGQAENGDGELELEIDQLSDEVLIKLWDLCKKSIPGFGSKEAPATSPKQPKGAPQAKSKPKHKPMSASEQDRKIQELLAVEARFKGGASKSGASASEQQGLPEDDDSDSDESSSEED
jgi:bromodomain-containing factor 1